MIRPRKDQRVRDMNAVSEIVKKLIRAIIVNGYVNDGIGHETREHFFQQGYRIVDQVFGLAWIVLVDKDVGQIVSILPVDDFAGIVPQRHGHGFHAACLLAHAPFWKPGGAFRHDAASGISRQRTGAAVAFGLIGKGTRDILGNGIVGNWQWALILNKLLHR